MSNTFYIFRHGETYFSKNNVPYGDKVLTAELLPEAQQQLRKVASELKDISTDFNVSSPVKRCKESAAIVSEITGKEFVYDERLSEWIEKKESFEALRDRLADFLSDMKKSKYKDIAVCTHGACIAGLKHLIEEGKFEPSDIHDYPTPGVVLTLQAK